MEFRLACLLFAGLLAAHTVLCGWAVRRWPELWKRLPRERFLGATLAAVALAWGAYEGSFLLEGGLRSLLWVLQLLVPVLTVLAFLYLEFLLARAVCGLALLFVPFLLQQAFTLHLPGRPLFSLLLYVIAMAAMYALAVPWRYRDWLEQCKESARVRLASCALTGAAAVAVLAFALRA